MAHYAPKKTLNNTSIINHLGINVVLFKKKLQSIEERFCDFYKSYILGEKEEENRIIANKK